MSENQNIPVWDVYDLFRTARLNVKYFSARLGRIEKQNLFMEVVLLISAPTSAVAGLWFFDTPVGEEVWKCFGILTAIVAVLKPLANLNKKIKKYEEVLAGYRALEHDLHEITILISQEQAYTKELKKEFKKTLKRKGVLVSKNPESKENKKLKISCEQDVLRELPIDHFYEPKDED